MHIFRHTEMIMNHIISTQKKCGAAMYAFVSMARASLDSLFFLQDAGAISHLKNVNHTLTWPKEGRRKIKCNLVDVVAMRHLQQLVICQFQCKLKSGTCLQHRDTH